MKIPAFYLYSYSTEVLTPHGEKYLLYYFQVVIIVDGNGLLLTDLFGGGGGVVFGNKLQVAISYCLEGKRFSKSGFIF